MRFTGSDEEAKERTLESTTPRAVKIRRGGHGGKRQLGEQNIMLAT